MADGTFDDYEDNYFDLDSILSEQQKLSVSFTVDVPGLGFLENNPGGSLHSGEKVLLPFWAMSCLTLISSPDNEPIIDIVNPKCFGNQCLNQLIAGPTTVHLYQLCPYFYQFGCNLLKTTEDSKNISSILFETFKKRISLIMDYSEQIQITRDKAEFVRGLDEMERQLYKCGCESIISMKKWVNREYGTLKIARSLNKSRLIL
ncbi:DNA replication complex GINS protein psf3 [Piromyces finnis]|uniref:DNA replication complex GINS protein PSF3 n=1 Tax=Piromyces finnis TaxID=1754191 RepID=A0A1Y1V419_9FUNG|nr:DNA replication complex GINS protein psf3 [Piromyces finnis]|eukprot:ORX46661.1 DNA replication complex GINS protein psf3 [Piromyces finnis]